MHFCQDELIMILNTWPSIEAFMHQGFHWVRTHIFRRSKDCDHIHECCEK